MKMKPRFFILLLASLHLLSACNKGEDPALDTPAGMPYEKLSDYGFFASNIADLQPVEGVFGYDMTTPLFTDYAQKARFIVVPEGKTVPYNDYDHFDFPVGTVLIKNFYYNHDMRQPEQGRTIIETRVLIRFDTGWEAFLYLWNDEQTDAFLSPTGKTQLVSYIDEAGNTKEINYVVPNQQDCKECHSLNNAITPIGPKARYLNRDYAYPEGNKNILTKLAEEGVLTGLPDLSQVPAGVVWDDPTTGSLEERARTYLDINCGHCHRPSAPASNTRMYLYKHETNPTNLGFCKRPMARMKDFGGLEFDIVPGDAAASIVIYRMKSNEPGILMPEIGRTVQHTEAIALIEEWINSLPPENCN